jgi:hypothetical protein
VFLTPEGDEASGDDWVSYSYADLHKTFTRTRKANAGAIGGDVAVFLDHYLSLIGNRFMENEQITKLCRQIYSNHRRALDLILERVGTPASGVVGRIEKWIEARPDQWLHVTTKQREIEFIPAVWNKMLPPIGKRKTFEPDHWLTVRLRASDTKLRLLVVVCPTSDGAKRKRVLDRLLKDKSDFGFSSFFKKKELTEDWTRVLSEEICAFPEDGEIDVESVMSKVEKRLVEFLNQTAKLPAAMAELFAS